jgi:hypothetical protein
MTMYQLPPAEDTQKAVGNLLSTRRVHERSTPSKIFYHFFPG